MAKRRELTENDIRQLTPSELALFVALLATTEDVARELGQANARAVSAIKLARLPDTNQLRYPDFPDPIFPTESKRGVDQIWWLPDVWKFMAAHPGLGRKRRDDPGVTPPA